MMYQRRDSNTIKIKTLSPSRTVRPCSMVGGDARKSVVGRHTMTEVEGMQLEHS